MNLPENIRVLAPSNEAQHSMDAEKGLLGSMLIDARCITEVVRQIDESYFYVYAHQVIYRFLVAQWEKGEATDLITFTQLLRDVDVLNAVGGAAYVTELLTFVPTAANVQYYLEIVRDKYILRELFKAGNEVARRAQAGTEDVTSLLEESEESILKIGRYRGREDKSHEAMIDETVANIMRTHEAGGALRGVATGLKDLDAKLGGLRAGQLIVLAGETGEGKTALALTIADHAAVTDKKPVGIISLEMGFAELYERIIAARAMVNFHEFYTHGGDDADIENIIMTAGKIKESPLTIKDESDVTVTKLRAMAREMKYRNKIELLILDYVQLISFQGRDENRERQISEAVEGMKQCAKELDIALIAISQVNDKGQLRESRAIGHHADVVLGIDNEGDESIIVVRKQRSGPTGCVPMTFLRDYAKFVNAAKIWQRDEN